MSLYTFNLHPGNLSPKLAIVAGKDVNECAAKDATYGSSWKQRGGVGAFMMLARKWDRIEKQTREAGWDVFAAVEQDNDLGDGDKLLSDIGDLRRYLLLVETELMERSRLREEQRTMDYITTHSPTTGQPLVPTPRPAGVGGAAPRFPPLSQDGMSTPRGFCPEQE